MEKYTLWGNEVDLELPKETFPTDDEIKSMEEIMSNCEHGYFDGSTRHSKKLHYRKWKPTTDSKHSDNPKGVCVFHHGIHGESGQAISVDGKKYGTALLVEFLIESGYILYSLDMLGHGYSEGERYFIPDSDWSIGRDDLRSFAMFAVGQEDSELPFFLMGESYGACLVLHVARQWMDDPDYAPSNFRGICILSPGTSLMYINTIPGNDSIRIVMGLHEFGRERSRKQGL